MGQCLRSWDHMLLTGLTLEQNLRGQNLEEGRDTSGSEEKVLDSVSESEGPNICRAYGLESALGPGQFIC